MQTDYNLINIWEKKYMEKTTITDGCSLKEPTAVLSSTTAGVKNQDGALLSSPISVVTYGNPAMPLSGIVYRRWLEKPDCEDHGKSYVGETMDETTRKRSWQKPNSPEYGGYKINSARKKYGLLCWGYEVLETVYAETKEELKRLLYKRETFYIAKFNSYENGFNGNRGGVGNRGVEFDEARRKQNGDNRRGKKQKPETIEILRKKSTGRIKSDVERAKISAANSSKRRTQEMRTAQSNRMKGVEPMAATAGAKAWRERNGGGSWKGKRHPPSALTKRSQSHRMTSQRIKVVSPDGSVNYYLCQADAAKATSIADGSISYALDHHNGLHKKTGYKFERITNEEYRQAMHLPD